MRCAIVYTCPSCGCDIWDCKYSQGSPKLHGIAFLSFSVDFEWWGSNEAKPLAQVCHVTFFYFFCGKIYITTFTIFSILKYTIPQQWEHSQHISPLSNSRNHPNQKLAPLKHWLPIPPSSQPLVTSCLLSVSPNLPVLDMSCKKSHTLFVLLCLAYFI